MKKNTGSQQLRNSVIQSEFHLRPKVAALAVAACFSSVVLANPTAPTVVHGTASFAQAGSILNVTNSHNAIINWGSFSIGVNELTKFIQPSALSAVLNRVVGQDPSAILGALQSNGRVFLLNPNGIVFGAGSQINVAGLVASTLNMSNADFLAGRMNFTDGAGAGAVMNNGSINASGGPVYMVGNAVTNNGIITSPGGEIVLAAGNSVELVNPGTPNLRVEIQAGDNEARNLGSVVADAGRIGIYAGLIKQGGVLNADSAVAEGGRIMLKSTKRTDLEAGSVTSARGTSGGQIIALSGMTDGVTTVAGTLDASATAGNGGFIETSAARVNVADSAFVTTKGAAGGQTGLWLIDPVDYFIASYGGDITGAALGSNLADSNVTLTTGAGGNMHINDQVIWSSSNTLTLNAHNDIMFGATAAYGGAVLDAGIKGSVVLNAGNQILTNNLSAYDVRADTLTASAPNGIANSSFSLRTNVAGANLTNSTAGGIYLLNTGNLSVTASSASDIIIYNNGNVTVPTGGLNAGGALIVYAPHIEIHGNSSGTLGVNLQAALSASIIVDSGANLTSSGGDINLASNRIDLTGAGEVRGNNIYLSSYGNFSVGDDSEKTMAPASFSKLKLNDSTLTTGGVVEIFGQEIIIEGPITLQAPKVENLALRSRSGVSQNATGAISVKRLHVDGGEGFVLLESALNNVRTLSGVLGDSSAESFGSSPNNANFYFSNVGDLEVGTVPTYASGINVFGNYGSDLSLDIVAGNALPGHLTINAPITSAKRSDFYGGDAFSTARIELAAAGNITATNTIITANGGYQNGFIDITAGGDIKLDNTSVVTTTSGNGYNGTAFGARAGLHAGGQVQFINNSVFSAYDSGYAGGTVDLIAGGNINVAYGSVVRGRSLGETQVFIGSTGGVVDISGTVQAHEGSFSDLTIVAANGIHLNTGAILQGTGSGNGSLAATTTTGNILQNAAVHVDGAEGSSIFLAATSSAVIQTDPSGSLKTTGAGGSNFYQTVSLNAATGIGSRSAPIRIDVTADPDFITARNTGSTGDIALSFFNTASLGIPNTNILSIDGNLSGLQGLGGLLNSNPTGLYYIESDKNIRLSVPFLPNGEDLQPGQSVVLNALNGDVTIGQNYFYFPGDPPIPTSDFGSIKAGANGGSGNVELIATGTVKIEAGSFVAGNAPLIKAADVDLQGVVRSGGNVAYVQHASNGQINLGVSGLGAGGALALDNDELNRIGSWSGTGDPLDFSGGSGNGGIVIGENFAGPLVFKGPVGPTYAFLNVRGSTVTQDPGASITGGLSVGASYGVSLTDSGNQINYISGSTNTGTFAVSTGTDLNVSGVSARGGTINLSSTGIMSLRGTVDAGNGTVNLNTPASIVDNNTGVDVIANSASFNGTNGIGSLANPLETSVLSMSVISNGSGQEIGIINAGNLALNNLTAAYGGMVSIGTTGSMTTGSSIYTAANLALFANNGLTVGNSITGSQNLSLNAGAGNLLLDNVNIFASDTLSLSGANIVISSNANVRGYAGTTASAVGNLSVLSQSTLGTASMTEISAGGNIVVDRSFIYGSPDVQMTLGGVTSMVSIVGDGFYSGGIAAGSPTTILLNFLERPEGNSTNGYGFSVNGIDGQLFDAVTNTGFTAVESAAALGQTMMVTYGGVTEVTVPPVTPIVETNQAAKPPENEQSTGIVAMNQAAKTPEKEQSTGAMESKDEKNKDKKKDLPICGK